MGFLALLSSSSFFFLAAAADWPLELALPLALVALLLFLDLLAKGEELCGSGNWAPAAVYTDAIWELDTEKKETC